MCKTCQDQCSLEWGSNKGPDSYTHRIHWCVLLGSLQHVKAENQCGVSKFADQSRVQSGEPKRAECQAQVNAKD